MKMQGSRSSSTSWMNENVIFLGTDCDNDEDDDHYTNLDSVSEYTPAYSDINTPGPYSVTSFPPSVGPEDDALMPTPHMYAPTSPVCGTPPNSPDYSVSRPSDNLRHFSSAKKALILSDQVPHLQTESHGGSLEYIHAHGSNIFGQGNAQKPGFLRQNVNCSLSTQVNQPASRREESFSISRPEKSETTSRVQESPTVNIEQALDEERRMSLDEFVNCVKLEEITGSESQSTNGARKRTASIFSNPDFLDLDSEIPAKRAMLTSSPNNLMPNFLDVKANKRDSCDGGSSGTDRFAIVPQSNFVSRRQESCLVTQNPAYITSSTNIARPHHYSLSDAGQFGQTVQSQPSSLAASNSTIFDHNGNFVHTESQPLDNHISPWFVGPNPTLHQQNTVANGKEETRLQTQHPTTTSRILPNQTNIPTGVVSESRQDQLHLPAELTTHYTQQIIDNLPAELTTHYTQQILDNLPAELTSHYTQQIIDNLPAELTTHYTQQIIDNLPAEMTTHYTQQIIDNLPAELKSHYTQQIIDNLPDDHTDTVRSTIVQSDSDNQNFIMVNGNISLLQEIASDPKLLTGLIHPDLEILYKPHPDVAACSGEATSPATTTTSLHDLDSFNGIYQLQDLIRKSHLYHTSSTTDCFPFNTEGSDISILPADSVTAQVFVKNSTDNACPYQTQTDNACPYQTQTFHAPSVVLENRTIFENNVMVSGIVDMSPSNNLFSNSIDQRTAHEESSTLDGLVQDSTNFWTINIPAEVPDNDDIINGIKSQVIDEAWLDIPATRFADDTVSALQAHHLPCSRNGRTSTNSDIDYLTETNLDIVPDCLVDQSLCCGGIQKSAVVDQIGETTPSDFETSSGWDIGASVLTDPGLEVESPNTSLHLPDVTDVGALGKLKETGQTINVKLELKSAILNKRQKEGKAAIEISFQPVTHHELTEAEREKEKRRKELNRKAAANHRQKKKASKHSQDKEYEEEMEKNCKLKKTIGQLEDQIISYGNLLQRMGINVPFTRISNN